MDWNIYYQIDKAQQFYHKDTGKWKYFCLKFRKVFLKLFFEEIVQLNSPTQINQIKIGNF